MKKYFTILSILVSVITYSKSNLPTASTDLVISQIYGGAGCMTAGCSTYKNDFIELYNTSSSAVSLSGLSVQYSSATSVSTTINNIIVLPNVLLQPGRYFLIAESLNATGTSALPTPDATGTIFLSATNGKVFLVNGTAGLVLSATGCPTTPVIDMVGYGTTANCFEGASRAPDASTSNSIIRNAVNLDTDDNGANFTTVSANPRNSTFGTLPITLQNFTANKNGNNTELHWQVNCLSTSVIFELQRSIDADNFQTFYTSSETKARCAAPFNYTHSGVISGKNYYRIKIIDVDGKISYSNIVLVANGFVFKGLLTIHPNIVTKQVDVYYTSEKAEKIQWIVTDLQGRIVKKVTSSVVAGDNKVEITTSDLTTGQYQVKGFTNLGSTSVIKFIKQ